MSPANLPSLAFRMRVRPGMIAEYRRRHAEIWPEMVRALHAEGILRYEIFLCEDSREVFAFQLRLSETTPPTVDPVIRRWRAYMADVLEMDGDMPLRLPLERVFRLDMPADGGE